MGQPIVCRRGTWARGTSLPLDSDLARADVLLGSEHQCLGPDAPTTVTGHLRWTSIRATAGLQHKQNCV